MNEKWDFYFTRVNDECASINVNLGLEDSAPDAKRPWAMWIIVYFNNPNEDGMPTSDEAEILWKIEDSLDAAVKKGTGASQVGRITTQGYRQNFFYGKSPADFDDAVARGMKSFPDYKFEFGSKSDPEWSFYRELLFPSPQERQCIENRHVIEVLEKNGDKLEKERPVFHWIYFETKNGRSDFRAAVEKLGFKVLDERVDEESSSHRWSLQIERKDFVDWNSINDVTIELFELANANGGDYSGWETSVERD